MSNSTASPTTERPGSISGLSAAHAYQLADMLIRYADAAEGHCANHPFDREGEPAVSEPKELAHRSWCADLAVLLDALEDVSITDPERQSLLRVCGLGRDVAQHMAALITRARCNSTADR